jgi:K+-transporting ATPase KdpF subunit
MHAGRPEPEMVELALGGATAALLAVYLVAALLWPQRF